MKVDAFRLNMQTACATCGAEWFGKGGEAVARAHAQSTGHQVQIQVLLRETLNPVAENGDPDYAPLVELTPTAKRLSLDAARERVTLFDGPINQRVPR
ncbi:hypothetical protein [Devosia sp. 2618]|uniref:hypothetical protein n=1 Tax=Devosia sp. 2618 TaxID=3156454 RepID=UPI003396AFFE